MFMTLVHITGLGRDKTNTEHQATRCRMKDPWKNLPAVLVIASVRAELSALQSSWDRGRKLNCRLGIPHENLQGLRQMDVNVGC